MSNIEKKLRSSGQVNYRWRALTEHHFTMKIMRNYCHIFKVLRVGMRLMKSYHMAAMNCGIDGAAPQNQPEKQTVILLGGGG